MASTLFGGSGGAIYMKKGLARAGVHIILARIVGRQHDGDGKLNNVELHNCGKILLYYPLYK